MKPMFSWRSGFRSSLRVGAALALVPGEADRALILVLTSTRVGPQASDEPDHVLRYDLRL